MTLRNRLGIAYRNLFAPMHLAASRAELKELLATQPATPAGWAGITEKYRGRGWFVDMRAWQVPSEFESMIRLVQEAKPSRIMEIGTAKGATLLCWCRIASSQVISVDLPGGIHGGGYPAVKQSFYREFIADRPGVRLDLFQEDSHSHSTRQMVEEVLGSEKLDVLFIDGDHTYAGVKQDFELWAPLVKAGGRVIFHDILPHKDVAGCEVDRLWRELKTRYPHTEFVENSEQGWAGIGVIEMM